MTDAGAQAGWAKSRDGDEAEERLAALIHDLQTPLAVITGFCELLERQPGQLSEEQAKEYLGRVAAAAGELRDILDGQRGPRPPGA